MISVTDFFRKGLSSFPRMTFFSLIEILIIAYIVYEILLWIRNTRAWMLLRGLILILAFTFVSYVLSFNAILWILGRVATIAVTALIIIFQPELRRALEQLGKRNFLSFMVSGEGKGGAETTARTVEEIVRAAFAMSRPKTGALIVIERKVDLTDVENSGIAIDGRISSQLLINIFEHNTPLHDGAVLIRGNTLVAATCYLPLSANTHISKDLGTRHRAAIGVSEVSDSITVVVSEETGRVSVARGGSLKKTPDAEALRRELDVLLSDTEGGRKSFFMGGILDRLRKGNRRNEKQVDQ